MPDICLGCSHSIDCRCCHSDEYSDCKLRAMSIDELINLINQITGERDYYRDRVENRMRQLENYNYDQINC